AAGGGIDDDPHRLRRIIGDLRLRIANHRDRDKPSTRHAVPTHGQHLASLDPAEAISRRLGLCIGAKLGQTEFGWRGWAACPQYPVHASRRPPFRSRACSGTPYDLELHLPVAPCRSIRLFRVAVLHDIRSPKWRAQTALVYQ